VGEIRKQKHNKESEGSREDTKNMLQQKNMGLESFSEVGSQGSYKKSKGREKGEVTELEFLSGKGV